MKIGGNAQMTHARTACGLIGVADAAAQALDLALADGLAWPEVAALLLKYGPNFAPMYAERGAPGADFAGLEFVQRWGYDGQRFLSDLHLFRGGHPPQTGATMQAVETIHLAGATAGATALPGLGGVLGGLLSGLFSAGPWLTVFEWVVSHSDQIKKAVGDVLAGADFQTVLNDLLALLRSGQ